MDNETRRVVSAHFKRQNNKSTSSKIEKLLILVMILVLAALVYKYIKNKNLTEYAYSQVVQNVEEQVLETTTLKAEIDIAKSVLEVMASKAERYVSEINNEIEYITLTESGSYTVSHSRLGDDAGFWKKTFKKSKIEVNFDYQAIFSIKTSDIFMYTKDGSVVIEYDPINIIVKSVEVSEATAKTEKAWFGKSYSNQDALSLIEITKEEIYNQLNSSTELKTKSCENLNTYFTEIAEKLDLDELVINSKTVIEKSYNFINKGTIQFNHSFTPLEQIDYIVIHSTGVNNITALQFYDNLNNYVQEREASAHFYIDDENIVQAIATNLQAWHCGTKSPKINCTNANSIGVEIAQFDNPEKQQKAIENASKFVKEVLLAQFPNAKIVAHRQIKPTLCPSILTDEQFTELFLKEN